MLPDRTGLPRPAQINFFPSKIRTRNFLEKLYSFSLISSRTQSRIIRGLQLRLLHHLCRLGDETSGTAWDGPFLRRISENASYLVSGQSSIPNLCRLLLLRTFRS
jgi:hypothetical protein